MRLLNILTVSSLLLLAGAAQADLLIQNVKVVTADNAQGKVTDVLVKGNKIARLGDSLSIATDVETINGQGKILTAGFFNSHTQLGLTEVGAVSDTVDDSSENARITASLRVSDAINPSSVLLPHNRMLGLTHALVQPAAKVGLFAGTAAIIQLSETDTVRVSNAAMVMKLGPHGKNVAGGSRAAAMAQLREAVEDTRDYANNKDSYNRGNRRDYALSRHDLQALVPVVTGRMPLIVHVDRAVDIERIIDFTKSKNIRLIIAGAAEGWRVAKKLADNKIPVIIDPINNLPSSYDTLGSRLDNAKILDEAGVTILLTGMSWHNTHNAYLVRQSAGNAVANGLSYATAIKSMTSTPAKVFGLKDMGEVKAGSYANLVLWSGDPLETSTIVEKVLINGVDQPLVSRATRLRDRYFGK